MKKLLLSLQGSPRCGRLGAERVKAGTRFQDRNMKDQKKLIAGGLSLPERRGREGVFE